MQLFISEVISSITQIIVFGLIPFIWWFVAARKKESFFKWVGLKKPKGTSYLRLLLMMAITVLVFLGIGEWSLRSMDGVETATSQFAGIGVVGIPAILIYACFHTAFSEELFFRGFLLKRIAAKFGFWSGNIVQAVLFGAIHAMSFFLLTGWKTALLLFLFTGGIAIALGYINEKKAEGSIFPGWCIHAVTNIISALIEAL